MRKKALLGIILAICMISALSVPAFAAGSPAAGADSVYVGWWSIVPAALTIVLALITKNAICSMLLGIVSGSLIFSFATQTNPLTGAVVHTLKILISEFDVGMIIVIWLLSALVYLLGKSGGHHAIGMWALKHLKTKRSSMLLTAFLGLFLFLSDSFHILATGAIGKPLTENHGVSKVKLAYILDGTAAPLCCIAPIGNWITAIIATFPVTTLFTNGYVAFYSAVPFNLYCIFSILLVFWLCYSGRDFGAMRRYEQQYSEMEEKHQAAGADEQQTVSVGKISDMVVPLVVLVVTVVFFFFQTGGFWTHNRSVAETLSNMNGRVSITGGCLVALIVACILYVFRKRMTFKEFMENFQEGVASGTGVALVLTFAWGVAGVSRHMLQIGEFVTHTLTNSTIPVGIFPLVFFIVSCLLSFATGTSWGTFAILLPLIFPVCEAVAPELIYVTIASVLGGSTFGDHCSPISDSTILSSGIAGCDNIEHVQTQMPYALVCAVASGIGYVVAGFTGGNLLFTILVSFAIFIASIWLLSWKRGSVSLATGTAKLK